MSGYSAKPLVAKLGIKGDSMIHVAGAPMDYAFLVFLVSPLPGGVTFSPRISRDTSLVHHFLKKRAELARALKTYRRQLSPEAVVWVSWPKKSAKIPTDITEDVIRELALPLGFVDVKVCAVDEVWSGLKLVVRKELR